MARRPDPAPVKGGSQKGPKPTKSKPSKPSKPAGAKAG